MSTKHQEAANPQSSPARLSQLSRDSELTVREEVAKNPNTPLADLFALWARHPRHFLQNPIVPLLLLEDPNFLWKAPGKTLSALLSMNEVPSWILESVYQHPREEFRLLIVDHPKLPPELLARCASSKEVYPRRRAAKNPKLPAALCELLSEDIDDDTRRNVAANPNTPASTIEKLSRDEAAKAGAAKNPNVPLHVLEALAMAGVYGIAENPRVSAALLSRLVSSDNTTAHQIVAAHPKTPGDVLALLATSENEYVVRCLSINPNTPREALRKIAARPLWRIEQGLAMNPNTPIEVLLSFLQNPKPDSRHRSIRSIITRRFRTETAPAPLLEEFAQNEDPLLRIAAASNPSTPLAALEILARDAYVFVRSKVASHPGASPSLLEFLALDHKSAVRQKVAASPNAMPALLAHLSRDAHSPVRRQVAMNSSTPHEARQRLSQDPEAWVRCAAERACR